MVHPIDQKVINDVELFLSYYLLMMGVGGLLPN